MYLKKGTINEEMGVDVWFEKVADDLLMVSIASQTESHGILSYWRLTKVAGIPPLEIGIDCENGGLTSFVFYIDASYVKRIKKIDVPTSKGSVLVDAEIFKRVNDYIDIEQTYKIIISGDKLLCTFANSNEFMRSYQNGRLEIFVDSQDQIVGFSVWNLSEKEMGVINSLQKADERKKDDENMET